MAHTLVPKGELDALGITYATGKSSRSHDYLRFYEFFLAPLRDEEFTFVELGVGVGRRDNPRIGPSLQMWRDFFPKAQIVGVDVQDEAKTAAGERITVEIGDLGDAKFLDYLAGKYKPRVILDDASHFWPHQILGLERLFDCLEPGGVYIIEDLVTSFGPWTVENTAEVNPVSYLATLHALVSGGGEDHPMIAKFAPTEGQRAMAANIDVLSIYKSATLLIKKPALLDKRQLRRLERDQSGVTDPRRAERLAKRERNRARVFGAKPEGVTQLNFRETLPRAAQTTYKKKGPVKRMVAKFGRWLQE